MSLQLISKLEEKCSLLPVSHKEALSADPEEIMYTTPGDVGIYYDDDGQHGGCVVLCGGAAASPALLCFQGGASSASSCASGT